jgi:hypothetical protein
VVETAEQVADGHVSRERLGAVWYQAYRNLISDEDADAAYSLGWGGIIDGKRIFGKSVDQRLGVWFYALNIAWEAADAIARSQGGISCLEELPVDRRNDQARIQVELFKSICRQERPHHAQLIRCVFSSPCRAATLNDAWLTRSVVELAGTIYERRDFTRLPSLAAMLEEAGCREQAILFHCREEGPHTRGCWPVDLILGKP